MDMGEIFSAMKRKKKKNKSRQCSVSNVPARARVSDGSRGKETRSKRARTHGGRSPHEGKRGRGKLEQRGDPPSPAARVIPILLLLAHRSFPNPPFRESRVFNRLIAGIVIATASVAAVAVNIVAQISHSPLGK